MLWSMPLLVTAERPTSKVFLIDARNIFFNIENKLRLRVIDCRPQLFLY